MSRSINTNDTYEDKDNITKKDKDSLYILKRENERPLKKVNIDNISKDTNIYKYTIDKTIDINSTKSIYCIKNIMNKEINVTIAKSTQGKLLISSKYLYNIRNYQNKCDIEYDLIWEGNLKDTKSIYTKDNEVSKSVSIYTPNITDEISQDKDILQINQNINNCIECNQKIYESITTYDETKSSEEMIEPDISMTLDNTTNSADLLLTNILSKTSYTSSTTPPIDDTIKNGGLKVLNAKKKKRWNVNVDMYLTDDERTLQEVDISTLTTSMPSVSVTNNNIYIENIEKDITLMPLSSIYNKIPCIENKDISIPPQTIIYNKVNHYMCPHSLEIQQQSSYNTIIDTNNKSNIKNINSTDIYMKDTEHSKDVINELEDKISTVDTDTVPSSIVSDKRYKHKTRLYTTNMKKPKAQQIKQKEKKTTCTDIEFYTSLTRTNTTFATWKETSCTLIPPNVNREALGIYNVCCDDERLEVPGYGYVERVLAIRYVQIPREEHAYLRTKVWEQERSPTEKTCIICGKNGDLVLCETCKYAYHVPCIQMKEIPKDNYRCPSCLGTTSINILRTIYYTNMMQKNSKKSKVINATTTVTTAINSNNTNITNKIIKSTNNKNSKIRDTNIINGRGDITDDSDTTDDIVIKQNTDLTNDMGGRTEYKGIPEEAIYLSPNAPFLYTNTGKRKIFSFLSDDNIIILKEFLKNSPSNISIKEIINWGILDWNKIREDSTQQRLIAAYHINDDNTIAIDTNTDIKDTIIVGWWDQKNSFFPKDIYTVKDLKNPLLQKKYNYTLENSDSICRYGWGEMETDTLDITNTSNDLNDKDRLNTTRILKESFEYVTQIQYQVKFTRQSYAECQWIPHCILQCCLVAGYRTFSAAHNRDKENDYPLSPYNRGLYYNPKYLLADRIIAIFKDFILVKWELLEPVYASWQHFNDFKGSIQQKNFIQHYIVPYKINNNIINSINDIQCKYKDIELQILEMQEEALINIILSQRDTNMYKIDDGINTTINNKILTEDERVQSYLRRKINIDDCQYIEYYQHAYFNDTIASIFLKDDKNKLNESIIYKNININDTIYTNRRISLQKYIWIINSIKYILLKLPIKIEFFQHHLDGACWLVQNYLLHRHCILADESGLGKVTQVIIFILFLRRFTRKKEPILIVTPVPAVKYWEKVFKDLTDLNCIPYYGCVPSRRIVDQVDFGGLFNNMLDSQVPCDYNTTSSNSNDNSTTNTNTFQPKCDIIVTSYETMTSDITFIRRTNWHAILFTDSQRLRNSTSKMYRYVLDTPARFRVLLTEIQVQYNIVELDSLLNFTKLRKSKTTFEPIPQQVTNIPLNRVERSDIILLRLYLRRVRNTIYSSIRCINNKRILIDLTPQQRDEYINIYNDSKYFLTALHSMREVSSTDTTVYTKTILPKIDELFFQLRCITNSSLYIQYNKKRRSLQKLDAMKDSIDTTTTNSINNIYKKYHNDRYLSTPSSEEEETEETEDIIPYILSTMKLLEDEKLLKKNINDIDENLELNILNKKDIINSSKKLQVLQMLIDSILKKKNRVLILSHFNSMIQIILKQLQLNEYKYYEIDIKKQLPILQSNSWTESIINNLSCNIFVSLVSVDKKILPIEVVDTVIFFDSDPDFTKDIELLTSYYQCGLSKDITVYHLICKNTYEEATFKYFSSIEGDDTTNTIINDSTDDTNDKDINKVEQNFNVNYLETQELLNDISMDTRISFGGINKKIDSKYAPNFIEKVTNEYPRLLPDNIAPNIPRYISKNSLEELIVTSASIILSSNNTQDTDDTILQDTIDNIYLNIKKPDTILYDDDNNNDGDKNYQNKKHIGQTTHDYPSIVNMYRTVKPRISIYNLSKPIVYDNNINTNYTIKDIQNKLSLLIPVKYIFRISPTIIDRENKIDDNDLISQKYLNNDTESINKEINTKRHIVKIPLSHNYNSTTTIDSDIINIDDKDNIVSDTITYQNTKDQVLNSNDICNNPTMEEKQLPTNYSKTEYIENKDNTDIVVYNSSDHTIPKLDTISLLATEIKGPTQSRKRLRHLLTDSSSRKNKDISQHSIEVDIFPASSDDTTTVISDDTISSPLQT